MRESENKIVQRSTIKLHKIKENIYSFMLTPKDAFYKYNEDNSGRMTFDQFNKFLIKLSQLSSTPVPSFAIIKDLFDFIDIRRDGIIDLNEWM